MLFSFFAIKKQQKSRQALHEIIKASSQTCIFHHGCKKLQIYRKLQFLEDVLQVICYQWPTPILTLLLQLSPRFYHHSSGQDDLKYHIAW